MPTTITATGRMELADVSRIASEVGSGMDVVIYFVDCDTDQTAADMLEHVILDNLDFVRLVVVGYAAGYLPDVLLHLMEGGANIELHRKAFLIFEQQLLHPSNEPELDKICGELGEDKGVLIEEMVANARWRQSALAYHFGLHASSLDILEKGGAVVVDQHLFNTSYAPDKS